jgi:hypothetical protein
MVDRWETLANGAELRRAGLQQKLAPNRKVEWKETSCRPAHDENGCVHGIEMNKETKVRVYGVEACGPPEWGRSVLLCCWLADALPSAQEPREFSYLRIVLLQNCQSNWERRITTFRLTAGARGG